MPSVTFLWDAFEERFIAETSIFPVELGAEMLWQVTQSVYCASTGRERMITIKNNVNPKIPFIPTIITDEKNKVYL
jgi:hypothetical protein